MTPISSSSRFFVGGVILLSIAALLIARWATLQGAGLSADSVMYIGGARGLLAHRGYGMLATDGWFGPIVTYMPAYPAAIATIARFGVDVLAAARWVVVALFAVNVALIACVIWFNTNRSTTIALIGAAIFCASPTALRMHSSALSEALFTSFLVSAIWVFSEATKRERRAGLMALCGALLGLAYLTRYAAIAFIGSMLLMTLLILPVPWKPRLKYAAIMALTCAVAVVPWMIRNHLLGV